jgi:hypothetical protein
MTQADAAPYTLLEGGAEYELLSSADGTAYKLRFKTEHTTAHLAGEDAGRFRQDYAAVKAQFPGWQADQTLAQLWDQGGYSWLSVEDGG